MSSTPSSQDPGERAGKSTIEAVNASLNRRYAAERRFRLIGRMAVLLGLGFVALLFVDIVGKGYSAFQQTYIELPICFDARVITGEGPGGCDEGPLELSEEALQFETLAHANYRKLVRNSLRELFPDVSGRYEKRELYGLVSPGAPFRLRDLVLEDPSIIGQRSKIWLLANDDIDMLVKGQIDRDLAESDRRVKDRSVAWVDALAERGLLERRFNTIFFTAAASREPEQAGIAGALMGSFYTLLLTLAICLPIAVGTALYLEEFAPKSRWTDFIEVNINNLAAVPSIVFGLLGLAVFINFFGVPRSTPLVGALVLSLMTLPTIIIASRAALKSVPPSIRDAALSVGASGLQTQFHHVLPLALPGILTGTIVGMAIALGETAPLLMIGMVAFIVSIPQGALDPATVLPVQIFLWADSPERGFVERTSAAIMVLLGFLILMNLTAILLRKRFERRW